MQDEQDFEDFDDLDEEEYSSLTFQVDVGRGVIVLPMYEHGRKILPSLFETPILDLLDEEGDILEPNDRKYARFAVCQLGGDHTSHCVVEIDNPGATIH